MSKKRIAAIDIGSNAPKLMIAEKGKDNRPKIIESVRANLALGVDTYNYHVISEESLDELSEILIGFKQKLNEYKIKKYRVVATSAVREAKNKDFVLARIKQRTGFECEVLSNSEERYLHNLALSEDWSEFKKLSDEGCIVLDMGAGSLQVSAFNNKSRLMSQNLKLGFLRMNELFSAIQSRSSSYDKMMGDYISSKISALELFGLESNSNMQLVAAGNDVEYVRYLLDLDPDETYVSAADILDIYSKLLRTTPLELTLHDNIPNDVAENLFSIVLIIFRFLSALDLSGVYLPNMQLSYGLLFDLAMREFSYKPKHNHIKDTISAVNVMVKRYGGDLDHLYAKERDALAIYNVLKKQYEFPDNFEILLRLTVRMSELGKYIIPENHEKTSAAIVQQNEFIGLSSRSTEMIADAIRYSGGDEIPDSKKLRYRSYNYRMTVLKLTAILRVASALEFSATNKVEAIETKLKENELRLTLHVNDDINLERFALQKRSSLLKELFGISIDLKEHVVFE